MGKKKLLELQVKALDKRVLAISEKNPELKVRSTTRKMYIDYVKQMKIIFPENEEVKNLSEDVAPFNYADLSNLTAQLVALLDCLLKE